jgi:hypothetical protein
MQLQREQIEFRTAEVIEMMQAAPVPPKKVAGLLADLEDLEKELEFLRDGPDDSDEPFAMVCAPLKPVPHLNSGAIALPEPD